MMGILERDELLLQCRINAAFNFPAMSAFFVSMPQQQSGVNSRGMAISFAALCRDPHPLVRKTIAAGFHEVEDDDDDDDDDDNDDGDDDDDNDDDDDDDDDVEDDDNDGDDEDDDCDDNHNELMMIMK